MPTPQGPLVCIRVNDDDDDDEDDDDGGDGVSCCCWSVTVVADVVVVVDDDDVVVVVDDDDDDDSDRCALERGRQHQQISDNTWKSYIRTGRTFQRQEEKDSKRRRRLCAIPRLIIDVAAP